VPVEGFGALDLDSLVELPTVVPRPEHITSPARPQAWPRPVKSNSRVSDEEGEEADHHRTSEYQMVRPTRSDQTGAGEDSHVIGGRYRIVEGIAMGGMGAVFLVTHLNLGKTFALKIIHQGLSADQQMRKFFVREAQVLSHLSHPNIVQVTDFGEDDRFGAYLVMEYLQGESLHARLQRDARLTIPASLQVGLQVAEALHYMHGLDLVHCDIKPENIFLCREPAAQRSRNVAKIIDFGLSRSMAKGAKLSSSEIGGTPHYAAPEQLAGMAPQPSMDIYAVGELLFTMITGKMPFSGSWVEVYGRKSTESPPPPSALMAESLDGQLEALILQSMQPKPEQRQASMAQLIFQLRTVMDMLGVSHAKRTGRHTESNRVQPTPSTVDLSPARVCDNILLPVFLLGPDERILSASPTFARLVHEPPSDLPGKRLIDTQIGSIYPGLSGDLRACVGRRSALQKRFKVSLEGGRSLTLYVWIMPQMDERGLVFSYWGIVMPLVPDP
jgi:serine/threonine-protein kinase